MSLLKLFVYERLMKSKFLFNYVFIFLEILALFIKILYDDVIHSGTEAEI